MESEIGKLTRMIEEKKQMLEKQEAKVTVLGVKI
jgi:hypothetical protein